jgi:hypothetical protein
VSVIIVPALLLLLFVRVYGVNGPESDHLNSAEIFERWDAGTFTAEFLFRPHNEHRKAVTRLVILGLGLATRFNTRAEMYGHWVLLCATTTILCAAFMRERLPSATWRRSLLLYAPISALVMSTRPYEIILGEGLPTFLSLMFLVATLHLLAGTSRLSVGFIGAVGCALGASFSLSNGLLAWPIGLLLLLAEYRAHPTRSQAARAAIWAIAGVATLLTYFRGYHDPGNHPSAAFVLSHPSMATEYLLALVGSALAPERHAARIVGAGVLILAAILGALVARAWWRERIHIPVGFWLMLLAIATALMITINRADVGADPIVASRYASFSVLAPIGLYWIAIGRRERWRFGRPLTVALATLLCAGYLAGSADAWSMAPSHHSKKALQAYLVYTAKYQATPLLEGLYPNPDHARLYSAALERLGLSVFAEKHVSARDLIVTPEAPPYWVDAVNGQPPRERTPLFVDAQDPILVAGWALDVGRRKPAAAVFLTIDGTVDMPGHMGIYRPDLGGRIRTRALRWGGFVGAFGGFVLSPGEHTVALKIVSADGRHAFVSPTLFRVIRR